MVRGVHRVSLRSSSKLFTFRLCDRDIAIHFGMRIANDILYK